MPPKVSMSVRPYSTGSHKRDCSATNAFSTSHNVNSNSIWHVSIGKLSKVHQQWDRWANNANVLVLLWSAASYYPGYSKYMGILLNNLFFLQFLAWLGDSFETRTRHRDIQFEVGRTQRKFLSMASDVKFWVVLISSFGSWRHCLCNFYTPLSWSRQGGPTWYIGWDRVYSSIQAHVFLTSQP